MKKRMLLVAFAGLAVGVGCESTPAEPEDDELFVLEVSGEQFRVRVADAEARAALEARRQGGVVGVVSGALVSGDGGFNPGWSWHLDPATVHAPDAAIELCDGRPSMVESDLAYWLGTVRTFCPWGASVIDRVGS